MISNSIIEKFIIQLKKELFENILPFWTKYTLDTENGGYLGEISNILGIDKDAPKGSIQHSRILWTYSNAYRLYKKDSYLKAAKHSYEFIKKSLWDKQNAGVYYSVNSKGTPIDDRKFIYSQAFAIYALSEYYRVSHEKDSLNMAIKVFQKIEEEAYDNENKGYFEVFNRNWSKSKNVFVVDKVNFKNVRKSMNAHLHIMESYTNLIKIWDNDFLKQRQKDLIEITIKHIVDEDYRFMNFFDEKWNPVSDSFTFGHDIEGSWLLWEAAEALNNKPLMEKVKSVSINMAQAVFNKAIDTDGGIFYESNENEIFNFDKHWWPQAEGVVGFINAYQLTRKDYFFDAAYNCWNFIENNIVDKNFGEWLWGIKKDGSKMEMPKGGLWKTPYHNGRACMELIERLGNLE